MIMPIWSDSDCDRKKNIIKKYSLKSKIDVNFPDYCQIEPKFDIQSTLKKFEKLDFIIADLSKERPSCYYELGLAQAIGKKVYLIAKTGTPIHQADGRNGVCFYNDLESLSTVMLKIFNFELNR